MHGDHLFSPLFRDIFLGLIQYNYIVSFNDRQWSMEIEYSTVTFYCFSIFASSAGCHFPLSHTVSHQYYLTISI